MPTNQNLKSVYDNTNKVTSTGLSVTYKQHWNGTFWEVTRYAKKSYSFIGMDEETAYECAAAKRSQYTRAFARLDTSTPSANPPLPTIVYAYECPSDIAPQHKDGGIWNVQIQVNEEDVRASLEALEDPSTLFSAENARNYDESAGIAAISLDSAERTGTTAEIEYTTAIAEFDEASLILQYKESESSTTWTTASRVSAADETRYTVPSTGSIIVRLKYGSIESNSITISED